METIHNNYYQLSTEHTYTRVSHDSWHQNVLDVENINNDDNDETMEAESSIAHNKSRARMHTVGIIDYCKLHTIVFTYVGILSISNAKQCKNYHTIDLRLQINCYKSNGIPYLGTYNLNSMLAHQFDYFRISFQIHHLTVSCLIHYSWVILLIYVKFSNVLQLEMNLENALIHILCWLLF